MQLRSSGGIDGFATPGITVDTTLDRFVVDTPGIYHLQARVQWNDPDAVGANDGDPGFRQIVVTRQFGATGAGATDIGAIDGGTVSDPTQIGSWYADLDAGDRVSVDVVQQTGAPQEVSGGSRISLVWVGPA